MGCNSHISIEVQGQWDHEILLWDTLALDIPESRDYALYEAMAGVRGEEENAVVAPRGIPVDASDAIVYWAKRWEGDGHTHSWLYPNEFHDAVKRAGAADGKVHKPWAAIDKILLALETVYGIEHVRIIFFFDN